MTTTTYFDGIPTSIDGVPVIGWHRRDTSPAGARYAGFGTYHTDVTLHLADGSRIAATISTRGPL